MFISNKTTEKAFRIRLEDTNTIIKASDIAFAVQSVCVKLMVTPRGASYTQKLLTDSNQILQRYSQENFVLSEAGSLTDVRY